MSKRNSTLTAARVREVFDYDPLTGIMVRKLACRGYRVGHVAGTYVATENRWTIVIDGVRYKLHRVIWLHYYGSWPVGEIDHDDRDSSNNAIKNLLDATRRENCENRGANKFNSSGVKGVSWNSHAGKWLAQIKHQGRGIYLGLYEDISAAGKAYADAAAKYHTRNPYATKQNESKTDTAAA